MRIFQNGFNTFFSFPLIIFKAGVAAKAVAAGKVAVAGAVKVVSAIGAKGVAMAAAL